MRRKVALPFSHQEFMRESAKTKIESSLKCGAAAMNHAEIWKWKAKQWEFKREFN